MPQFVRILKRSVIGLGRWGYYSGLVGDGGNSDPVARERNNWSMIYTSVHSMGNFYSDSKVCLYCVLRSCCVYPRALFLICGYTVPNSRQFERLLTIRVGLRHWLGFFFLPQKSRHNWPGVTCFISTLYTPTYTCGTVTTRKHTRENGTLIFEPSMIYLNGRE